MTINGKTKRFAAAALCGAMPFGFAASCDSYGAPGGVIIELFDSYEDDGFDDTEYYVDLGVDTLGILFE